MKKWMKLTLTTALFISGCCFLSCTKKSGPMANPERGFWSERPAKTWEEALLTGNGTQGALVMGIPLSDTIILSHARLYMPLHEPLPPVNTGAKLDTIRSLMLKGQYAAASQYVVDLSRQEGWGGKRWTDPFVPAFDIRILTEGDTAITEYRRQVNFQTGEASVSWTGTAGRYERHVFASRADTLIVIQLKGPGKGKLNCTISLADRPKDNSWWQGLYNLTNRNTHIRATPGLLTYDCAFDKTWPGLISGLSGTVQVITDDGTAVPSGTDMVIRNATRVLLLCQFAPSTSITPGLNPGLMNRTYSSLLASHARIHGELFNRVSLDLGSSPGSDLSSEKLLEISEQNPVKELIEKEFDAARYNILCATGIMPPNLQGIWAGTTAPPWSGDFTQNGNLQVAIAGLLSGNMPELMDPFFRYQEANLPAYRVNAKNLYGCRGIHVASRTSSHGLNNHFDRTWPMTFWTAGAAWMSKFYYDYWLYTGDTVFLRDRAIPFMKESALFYQDFLTAGPDGRWVFNPSYSPENNPGNSPDQACINATMDIAAARELFRNLVEAGQMVGISPDTIAQWQEMLNRMPPYLINPDGALREYAWDTLTDNYAHRHASHLYGLWEVTDPDFAGNPDLMKAARIAVEERMKVRRTENGGVMAFGMVQLALAAAAVGDSTAVGEMINWLARGYWFNNLVTTHNPREIFNLDLSGGFPAVIMKALVYSEPGEITLFPARPPDWNEGSLRGTLLRGNLVLEDLTWNEEATTVRLLSRVRQELKIRRGFDGEWQTVDLMPNRPKSIRWR